MNNKQVNQVPNKSLESSQMTQLQNDNTAALEGKTIVFQGPLDQNSPSINHQNQNITNQNIQNNEVSNMQNIEGYRCPRCGRELLGNPDICPYCNAKLR